MKKIISIVCAVAVVTLFALIIAGCNSQPEKIKLQTPQNIVLDARL